jgi:hypothetical protein
MIQTGNDFCVPVSRDCNVGYVHGTVLQMTRTCNAVTQYMHLPEMGVIARVEAATGRCCGQRIVQHLLSGFRTLHHIVTGLKHVKMHNLYFQVLFISIDFKFTP